MDLFVYTQHYLLAQVPYFYKNKRLVYKDKILAVAYTLCLCMIPIYLICACAQEYKPSLVFVVVCFLNLASLPRFKNTHTQMRSVPTRRT